MEICCSRAYPSSAFALRFAAKEAFSKAIGLGMRKGIRWKDIEVFHFPGGRPGLRLYGKSLDHCNAAKITGFHLSLSDEGEYGVATVILEKRDEAC
jgi:holo-[acyl-carrier protein] synthase